jgi:hypothetical protein
LTISARQKKLAKSSLLNGKPRIFFSTVALLNIMQFPMDISVQDTGKYWKLVLTSVICRSGILVINEFKRETLAGVSGSGKNICPGLEITYLLMYLWTRSLNPAKVSNQAVQRHPTAVLRPSSK